jgi:hypothetical protein
VRNESGDLPMVPVGPAPESELETAAARITAPRCLPPPRVSGPRLSTAADHARAATQHGRQPTSARHRPHHTTVAHGTRGPLGRGGGGGEGGRGASPTRSRYPRDHERKRPSDCRPPRCSAQRTHSQRGRKIHAHTVL